MGSCPVAGPLLAPVLRASLLDSVGGILDEAPASSPDAPLSPLWALAVQEPRASGSRASLSREKPAPLTLGGGGWVAGCVPGL